MSYNSAQIANFFIKKSHSTGIELTPMKLIKMAYIAHGWHLGLYDTELLDEVIYAWKYGPVITSMYYAFRDYGDGQIDRLYSSPNKTPYPDEAIIPFLEKIWDLFKNYDGIQLSSMTHQPGSPWYKVWNEMGGKDKKDVTIPNDIIKEFYKNRIQQVGNLNPNP